MADEPELAIVAKLTAREDGYPQMGRGTIDAMGRGTIEMDPAPQILVNPDGPEAAEIIKELVKAARPFADSIVIDPAKKRGERHWATCGKLTNLDDVLRLQAALSRAGANNDQSK